MKWPIWMGVLTIAGLLPAAAPAQRRVAPPVDAPVTFAHDVAPILHSQCASCHHPDGPAPFSLLTFDDARRRATQIAAVTSSRYMPPWKPEPGFGDLAGERRLSDEQILAIDRWVATGMLEGNTAHNTASTASTGLRPTRSDRRPAT